MSIPNQDTKQYSNPNNTDGSEPTNPAPVTIHDGTTLTAAPTRNNTETKTTSGNSGTLARTALLGITLITGIFILANLTTWAISQTLNNINLPIANYHILSLTYSAAILALTIAAAYPITRKLGTTIPKLLLGNFITDKAYQYLAAGALGAAALTALNVTTTTTLTGRTEATWTAPYQVMNTNTLLAYIGFTVLLAPLAEETLFRGALLSLATRTKIPGATTLMLIISSLGFTTYHIAGTLLTTTITATTTGNPNALWTTLTALTPQIINYTLAGIILSIITLKTKNIFASWLAHATYNLTLLYGLNTAIIALITH
jgi:membrane protein